MSRIDDWIASFLKAPQQSQTRRPRDVPFVGSDVLHGSEEFLDLDGREEQAQRLALTLPSAFSAANNVAKMCAQHDPHVGRQSGPDEKPKPQKNHAFERVMWHPNQWMSSTFLWWFTFTALPIRGEAYLFIEDGGLPGGDVKEIWPIPPWRVKPVPTRDSRTFIKYYNYWPTSGAEAVRMPASNVCWIRQPNILDLHAGMSSVSPAQKVIDTAAKQWWYRNNFFGKRRGRPEVTIGVKKEVSVPEFNVLKREIMQEFQVLDRGTLLHRAGDLDVKLLGMSADDMQLLQFQDHDAEVIQQLFGWNSSLGKATSYAHADVSWEIVAQIGAWPLMKLLSGALTNQVLQPRYGEDYVAYYDDIRPKRRDADRADYQVYGQEKTTNQLRIEQGDKPITEGPLAEAYQTITIRTLPAYLQMQQSQAKPEVESAQPVEPERPQLPEAVKADLQRWERKALRVLHESGVASASFESDVIPAFMHIDLQALLLKAKTTDDVKEVFKCVMQPS